MSDVSSIDSTIVQENFSQAAAQYERAALAQRFAADLVASKITQYLNAPINDSTSKFTTALEIGCGTGLLTHQLLSAYPWKNYLATDISQAMLTVCKKRCLIANDDEASNLRFQVLDANYLQINQSFDLIASSLCLQWVNDFFSVMDSLYAQSNLLVVSVLLDSSFMNWRNAHVVVDEPCRLQPLVNLEKIQNWIASKKSQGATLSFLQTTTFIQDFESPLDFPFSLKAIGAHTPIAATRSTNLRKVARACVKPFSVNYDIGLIVLA